jgi:hypothetical protein
MNIGVKGQTSESIQRWLKAWVVEAYGYGSKNEHQKFMKNYSAKTNMPADDELEKLLKRLIEFRAVERKRKRKRSASDSD